MDPKALGKFLMQPSTADVLNTPVRRGGILPVTEYPNRTEFDLSSGLTGALMNAFTAPARAARGEISEAEMIPEAFNFAGSLTLGSLLAPRPTGSVGMGGRAAKEALEAHQPVRAYHGTNRVFDMFKPSDDGNVGPGVYFSASPDEAATYGLGRSSDVFSPSVLPVEIRGKLASVDDYNAAYDAARDSVGSASEARKLAVETLRKAGFDGIEAPVGNTPNYSMFNPGTVYSATTGDLLFANAKTGAAVPLATKALEAQQPQGIRAFHGSPHDFDRFDMSKIGTGEGAQAYGHGLYFAEAEDVAKAYRDGLAKLPEPDAQAMQGVQGKLAELDAQIAEYAPYAASSPAMQRQVDMLNDSRANLLRQAAEETQTRAPSGHMYEVNIKANPEDFLDWYAPTTGATMERVAPLGVQEGAKGFDALQQVAARLAKDGKLQPGKDLGVQVSEALRDAGIPGIRYLDQMSRGEGKGSSNFVVFDDALIEILRKYGLLGPVAGGGTLAGMLMGGQDGEMY